MICEESVAGEEKMVRLTRVRVMSGEHAVRWKHLEGDVYSAEPCNTDRT